MITLKEILSNKEVQDLVDEKKAEYINFGDRRKEIVFIGKNIYYKHIGTHYHYIGKVRKFK